MSPVCLSRPLRPVVALRPLAAAGILLVAAWATAGVLVFGEAVLDWMEHAYGAEARTRAQQLQALIEQGPAMSERGRLERVNAFFNRIAYDSDYSLWDQKDYWATPYEVLGVNSADCEDYAISKYFTLVSMGMDEARLRITYVKSLTLDEAHMVLAYYPSVEAEPLILDNLTGRIQRAGERDDLVPVYSFNGTDLWLAVNQTQGRKVGGADRLSRWRAYQSRLMQQMAVGQ